MEALDLLYYHLPIYVDGHSLECVDAQKYLDLHICYNAQKTLQILANCFTTVRISGDSHYLRIIRHGLVNNALQRIASWQSIWNLDHKELNVFIFIFIMMCFLHLATHKEVMAHDGNHDSQNIPKLVNS